MKRLLTLVLVVGVMPALLAQGILAAGPKPPPVDVPGVEPFDPPPLDEIDAKAQWVEMPVVDSLKHLRDLQAGEKPLTTVQDAVSLTNDSDAANQKILSALGRLPDNDAQVNWDASMSRHFLGDVKSMNPLLASSTEEAEMEPLLSMNLFSFDWDLKPFARAEYVKSWQTSSDRTIDKVVMRDDMTWSDGKPITAYDVQFSYETIMNPKINIPAVRSGPDKLRCVVAYDAHTLLYFHKESLATNKWNVNFPFIPKHAYEKTVPNDLTLLSSPEHVALEENPVCGGPYVLSRRTRNQEIVLERRESYYMHNGKQVREKPYLKTIRFLIIQEPHTALLALKKGDLDELLINPEQWTSQTNDSEFYAQNTKVRAVEWVYFFFQWNLKTPFFSDLKVRQAMAYTMDYDEMLSKLCYGLYQPSDGIFHPGAWMYPKGQLAPYKQDLDKAEDLLDEAGWGDSDGDGIRDKMVDGQLMKFEFTMLCQPTPLATNVCTLMKENLEKIGILCNIQRLERTVMQQKLLDHEFQASIGGWGTGADPSTIDNIWKTDAQRNYGFYSNPAVDRLLDDAEKTFEMPKQAEMYGEIDKLIYHDQPYCFLYYRSAFYAFSKQMRGYKFSPRGPYHYSPGFMSLWRAAQ